MSFVPYRLNVFEDYVSVHNKFVLCTLTYSSKKLGPYGTSVFLRQKSFNFDMEHVFWIHYYSSDCS